MYVPGRNGGPTTAPPAALAAGGTRGGGSRMPHVSRLNPLRLLVGMVPSDFPVESNTSSVMSPKMCRFCR